MMTWNITIQCFSCVFSHWKWLLWWMYLAFPATQTRDLCVPKTALCRLNYNIYFYMIYQWYKNKRIWTLCWILRVCSFSFSDISRCPEVCDFRWTSGFVYLCVWTLSLSHLMYLNCLIPNLPSISAVQNWNDFQSVFNTKDVRGDPNNTIFLCCYCWRIKADLLLQWFGLELNIRCVLFPTK